MNKTTVALLFGFTCIWFVGDAQGQRVDNRALHAAATEFRNAVLIFERDVVRVRGVLRNDERIVDKFEEATKRVAIAAKNPRLMKRLTTEYRKMLPLQAQAERAIFGKYTPHHGLIQSWDAVLYFQSVFEQEFAFHSEYPLHGNRVQLRAPSQRPTTTSVTVPPPVGSFNANSRSVGVTVRR
ncbi:MAG: hypothetical protein HKN47_10695 [Pirellulaceae bacterium]|nr:hypothetical protein [Pirellulaceae bacterium]